MNIFRNDQQVALNDLLLAANKTADHYRYAAEFLHARSPGEALREIAKARDQIAKRLTRAIRSLGDLPSVPDEDRVSVEKIAHRIHASLSDDEIKDVLQQRLDGEQEIAELVVEARKLHWHEDEEILLADLTAQVRKVTGKVQQLMEEYSV